MNSFLNIITALKEISEDATLPKNVRTTVLSTIFTLSQQGEPRILASKALQQLEQLSDDGTVEPFTRTQLYNIVSMLEVVN